MKSNKLPAGWAMPGLSKKFHYFPEDPLTSICGKWVYRGEREPDNTKPGQNPLGAKDDCKECYKRLLKLINDEAAVK